MRKLIISGIILFMVVLLSSACASNRKYQSELRGLMLQSNLKLPRNKEFYSKHSRQVHRDAYRKYRRNSRNR